LAGFDVLRQPRQVRESIGLAGQHAAVDYDLSGRENLLILGYIFGSAITVAGGANHREFLLPGLLATTAANVLPPMIAMSRDKGPGCYRGR